MLGRIHLRIIRSEAENTGLRLSVRLRPHGASAGLFDMLIRLLAFKIRINVNPLTRRRQMSHVFDFSRCLRIPFMRLHRLMAAGYARMPKLRL